MTNVRCTWRGVLYADYSAQSTWNVVARSVFFFFGQERTDVVLGDENKRDRKKKYSGLTASVRERTTCTAVLERTEAIGLENR